MARPDDGLIGNMRRAERSLLRSLSWLEKAHQDIEANRSAEISLAHAEGSIHAAISELRPVVSEPEGKSLTA